ncbi:MAG: hypothetical protein AAGC91_02400 [Pseudomonadota bacterium]
MGNWQERIVDFAKGAVDKQSAVTAGLREGVEVGAETLEKTAGFQLGIAADTIDSAVAQLRLLADPGTPVNYLKQQAAMFTDGLQNARTRVEEAALLANESAAAVSSIFDNVRHAGAEKTSTSSRGKSSSKKKAA